MYIGPRLAIEHDRDADGMEYIYSGNGSTVDILIKRTGVWQIERSINVFADHSSTVCGIVVLSDNENEGRKLLCCFGERDIALFARDSSTGESELPRTSIKSLKDWILGVRPIGIKSNKIAVVLRSNVVNTYEFRLIQENILTLEELQSIKCEHSVALFSAVFTGNTFNTLRVLAGNTMGDIIFWKPSDNGKIERKISGHDGAIFALLEHKNVVYTISDDRSLKSWSLEDDCYNSDEFTKYAHTARPFAITQSDKYGIITGGADGNVCLWAFEMGEGFGLRKMIAATKSVIRSLCIVGDTLLVGSGNGELCVIHLHETTFHSETMMSPKIDIRNFVKLLDGRTLFLNKNNEFMEDKNGELIKISVQKAARFDTFKISPSGRWIAWNLEHDLCMFNVVTSALKKKKISSLTSLFWLHDDRLLVSTMDGSLALIDPDRNERVMCFDIKVNVKPGVKTVPLPTSAFLHTNLLYVGFKTGYLHVYKMNRTDSIAFVRAHGSEGIYDISAVNDKIISVGKNGKVCEWYLEEDRDGRMSLVSMNKRPVGSMGLDWPSKILNINGRIMIAGFHNEDFVLMDLQEEYILCKYKCGGGKREWMCEAVMLPTGSFEIRLRYILRGGIMTVMLRPFEKRTLVSGVHNGQITCIHTMAVRKAVPPKTLMITGGVDTEVVVSTLDLTGKHEVLYRYKTLSSVWDISRYGTYVLTVGGRSEMILWKIEGRTGNLVQLGKKRLGTDCRLISAKLLGEESGVVPYAVVAGSDNSVRLFSLNLEDKDNIATLISEHRGSDLATFTKLFATVVKDTSNVRVLAISSNGKMVRFKMSTCASKECGLSSLAVHQDITEDLVAIGDESGCLFVMVVPHDPNEPIKTAARCQVHTSNITDISIRMIGRHYILTVTGIDSRISLVLYEKRQNTIVIMKQKVVNVSDPSAFKPTDPEDSRCMRYVVVGAGLQLVNFESQQPAEDNEDD
ncbi:hypothetical protein QR680_017549 [Steinernema hermaphroditum]|uniref:tRNA (34-2'-O)-methyltransferase regulator WDR6 n=1 Tax=Steinernema hermaphroditum TaxID=289476 RepID=A0AA39HEZ7_9BILA|nr:hypothetical protein QR680_017549 [Steinernema hermaphroditum]